jgi:secreted trypsin-like serine protease
LLFFSYCNATHEKTSGKVASSVEQYLPELFKPNLLCAGYESAEQGSCKGDSGGPLMIFKTKTSQFFQLGMVAGSVSRSCGDRDIPAYYTRLDYPNIANFIQDPANFIQYPEIFIKQGKYDANFFVQNHC